MGPGFISPEDCIIETDVKQRTASFNGTRLQEPGKRSRWRGSGSTCTWLNGTGLQELGKHDLPDVPPLRHVASMKPGFRSPENDRRGLRPGPEPEASMEPGLRSPENDARRRQDRDHLGASMEPGIRSPENRRPRKGRGRRRSGGPRRAPAANPRPAAPTPSRLAM